MLKQLSGDCVDKATKKEHDYKRRCYKQVPSKVTITQVKCGQEIPSMMDLWSENNGIIKENICGSNTREIKRVSTVKKSTSGYNT